MNTKTGKCIMCPPDSSDKPLITDKCAAHYWQYRASLKTGSANNKAKKDKKAELNIFFADQLPQIPSECENCNKSITYYRSNKNMWRSLIAHILPKRDNYGFPTVATHPQNRVFLCPDCHGNYDNLGSDFAVKMSCLPTMRERFNLFKHLLSESELQRVPKYLKD